MLYKSLMLPQTQLKTKGEGGAMLFSAYGSAFGKTDSYGDTIVPGAYARWLESGEKIAMLWHHMSTEPIGKYLDAKEDDYGLLLDGELTPGVQRAHETYALMKHEAISGFSIGYTAVKSRDLDDGRRALEEIQVHEVSPLPFPADNFARLVGIKAAEQAGEMLAEIKSITTIRDVEQFLRDSGAFSRNGATTLVAQIKRISNQSESDDEVLLHMKAMRERIEANRTQ